MGSLPTNVGDLKQLQLIYLNGNQLSGSIPWELFGNVKGESQIQELILQQNSFTGTIPTQIGNLYHIEKIVLSHNSLRGTIPYEIQQLLNISLLHLHGNMLTGTAPIMPMFQSPTRMNKNTAFITDCGEPSFSSKSLPIQCESCTMCCNSLDTCQINIEWKTPVQRFGFLLVSFVPIGLMPMLVILFKLNQRGYFNFKSCWDREEERNPLSVYSEDSVYCLIFSSHPLAWCIFVGTATVQALAFNIFLIRSNFNDSDSTWNYTFRCPGNSNSIQCSNDSSKTVLGWIMFSVLVLGFLGSDFIDGLLQLRKAAAIQSARLFFSGWTLFFLTALALFTSVIYNVAVAESDLDLITNTVFLLFINDFDEQVLKILESMVPYWMGKRYVEIKRNMLEKRSERSIAIALENSNDTSLNDGSRGEIGVGVNVHVNGGPSSSSHRLERSRFAGFRDYSRRNLLSDPSLINNSNSHSHSHRHSSTCASSINNSVHLNKSKSDGIMQEVRRETGLKALGMWGVSGTRVTFELEDKPHMNEKRSS